MSEGRFRIDTKNSGEKQKKINQDNTNKTIDSVFDTEKAEVKKQMNQVIQDTKLNFTEKRLSSLLKKVKKKAEELKKIPILTILKKYLEAEKKNREENLDITKYPKLNAKRQDLDKMKWRNQADKEKNQAAEKGKQADKINMESIKQAEKDRSNLIKAAKESYQNLSPDLKQHSPEEINTKINALSPNTKARLKKSGLSLSDYAQFSLAREKITSLDTKTPEGESFLTTLKKMEKSLGIVEKTDGGYPLSNEPRKETFEQNPQLMEFAKNDESLKSLEKVNVLDDKLNIKQQQKIFQLFWDADQKRFFDQILPLLERKKKADLDHSESWFSAEEITALQQYQAHFDWLKKKFTDKNVNYLKAAAAQAPLVAILRYLDQDSLGKQTLADLMQKEGGEYATIEQHQDLLSWAEDKIMKIKCEPSRENLSVSTTILAILMRLCSVMIISTPTQILDNFRYEQQGKEPILISKCQPQILLPIS